MAYVGYEGYDTVVEDNQIYLKAKAEYDANVEQYDKDTKAREKQIKQKAKAEAELQQAKIEETQKYEETFANETKIYEKKIDEEQKVFKQKVSNFIDDSKKQYEEDVKEYEAQSELYEAQQDKINVYTSTPSGGDWGEFIEGKESVNRGGNRGRRPSNRKDATRRAIDEHFEAGTLPPALIGAKRGSNDRTNLVYTQMQQEYHAREKAKGAQANLKIAQDKYGFKMTPVPPNAGRDVFNKINNPTLYGGSRDSGGHTMPNVVLGFANKDLRAGNISIISYQEKVGQVDKLKREQERIASEARSRAFQVESRNQLNADRKHWETVSKGFADSKAMADKSAKSVYNPVTEKNILGDVKVVKPTAPEFPSYYNTNPMLNKPKVITSPQIDSKSYIVDQPKKGNQKVQAENMKQKIYTTELRKGNVGLATALLQPQTTQKYFGKDTRNLKAYLTSMGYDINNPDSIPDSVLMNPTKYRSGKTNDDGTFFVKKPMISTEVSQKRATARAKWEGVIIPDAPVEPIFGTPKQKVSKVSVAKVNVAGTADLPSWTFNGETFTDKSKLDAYVATREQQAGKNSRMNKVWNMWYQGGNVSGKLNPEGYIKGYKEPERVKDRVLTVEDIKPASWTFDDKTFTDKSTLTAYVENRKQQAQFNSDKNKLLNIQSNISGSLNPEGYIKDYKEPERAKDRLFSVEDIKPASWTFDGKTFTDKSTLTSYVENRTSQAQFNSDKNKLFNIQSNISGSLNPEGYIKDYKEPERAKDRLFSTSDIKPTSWTFDGKTFTDKSELNEYVLSSKSQGVLNSSENKLLNTQSNISGSLNPEGYIKDYKEPEKAKDRLFSVEDIKPATWTFKGKQFNSESELNEYVLSSKSQGVLNSSENKLLNTQSNTSGNLNSGYIEPLMGEGYNSNPVLNKPIKSATPTIAPPKTDSTNIPSNYSGNIFSVTNPLTGVTKEFRKESRAQEHVAFVNKEIEKDWDKKNPLPPKPQWVITTDEKVKIPKMGGGTTELTAEKENVFDSLAEAEAFDKAQKYAKSSGDYDNYSLANYSHSVRTGLVADPSTTATPIDDIALKFSQGFEPFSNTGKSVNNTVGGEHMGYTETAEEMLISGTIDDVMAGAPLRGTGVTSAFNEIVKDPSRFVAQLPATAVMYWTGGKAISLAGSGAKGVVKRIGSHLDNVGMSGGNLSTPAIITRDVGVAVAGGVTKVQGAVAMVPTKMGQKIVDYQNIPKGGVGRDGTHSPNQFTQNQLIVKHGLYEPYKKLTYFQKSPVGLGAKVFYVMTPKGKLHVRQVTEIAEKASHSVYDDTGKLIPKDFNAKPDYGIKWVGKEYAEIHTPDKIFQIARGKTSIIPKEEGVLTNKSVLVTKGENTGMIAGGYIGSGGKPFAGYKTFTGTDGVKIIPKEADTLRWRLFKGADIDLRTSPRQPSVPSGLVKPMDIDSYTVKGASDSFRDRLPYFGRNRQFKTSIEEINVISNPTKRTWLLESHQTLRSPLDKYYRGFQKSPKMSSDSTPSPVTPPANTPYQNMPLISSTGKDVFIPVKNQLTKNVEIMGEGIDKLNLKGAKIIETQRVFDTPKPYSPYRELVPKEGVPHVKGELTPKEGLPKNKFDNEPYPLKDKQVSAVIVATKENKNVIEEAIKSGKIIPVGKRTSITAEEVLKSGAGKQYGDNIFKKISTGQQGDIQIYQTVSKEVGKVKGFSPKLNLFPKIKFKPNPQYGVTKVVRDLDTQTGMPPIKKSEVETLTKKIKAEEPIDMAGSRGDGTIAKQLLAHEKSKSAVKESTKDHSLEKFKRSTTKTTKSFGKSPYSSMYIGGAVVEEIITTTETPQGQIGGWKDKSDSRISGKMDTGLGTVSDIQGKIDTRIDTGLITEPIIKQHSRSKSVQKPMTLTSSASAQKSVVTTQQQAEMFPQITYQVTSRTKKPKGGVVIPWGQNQTQTQRKTRKRGKKAGFIGNVRADSIVGVYKRSDITYGKKRVSKLERQDKSLSKKSKTRIDGDMTLFKTKKKKTKKTESLLGHTFKKSKDEFALGKQKGSKGKRVKASLF